MKTLGGVLVGILVGAILLAAYFHYRGRDLARQLEEADARLNEQLLVVRDLERNLAHSELAEQEIREIAEQQRVQYSEAIGKLQKDKEVLVAELQEEKEKIKQLSDSDLAVGLGAYVGADEIWETHAGLFHLTRSGAETGFSLFKEHTWLMASKEADKEIIRLQSLQVSNFEQVVVPSYERQLSDYRYTLDGTKEALSLALSAYGLCKKQQRKQFWKGFAYGTVGSVSILGIIKFLGG